MEKDILDDEEDDNFEIEDIINIRWNSRKKQIEYLIRWKDYSPEHDSWVLESDLNAPESTEKWIEKAEELKRLRSKRKNYARKSDHYARNTNPTVLRNDSSTDNETIDGPVDDDDLDLEVKRRRLRPRIISPTSRPSRTTDNVEEEDIPEKILGVTNIQNTYAYMVQFKGKKIEQAKLITSERLRQIAPQLIIDYFEPKIRFVSC